MAEWPDGWDGETVFYDEHGEIALSVRPRPNRAILFDSRIPHAGRAPSRQCPALRVTAAYKLLVAAAASEEPAELSLEGAVRHHRVAVPEERLAKLVSEHLEKLATTVRLPGFRPGKIPLELIAQRYGAAARAEVVKHLGAEAVFSLGKDAMIVSVETSELAGKIEIQIVAVHLADLPQPPSGVILERLTASQAQLDAAGLEPGALDAHWREQMMDRLDEAYRFPLPAGLVESERAAVEQAIGGPPAESEAVREVQR